jgi:hypothetical protein
MPVTEIGRCLQGRNGILRPETRRSGKDIALDFDIQNGPAKLSCFFTHSTTCAYRMTYLYQSLLLKYCPVTADQNDQGNLGESLKCLIPVLTTSGGLRNAIVSPTGANNSFLEGPNFDGESNFNLDQDHAAL